MTTSRTLPHISKDIFQRGCSQKRKEEDNKNKHRQLNHYLSISILFLDKDNKNIMINYDIGT